MPAHPKRRRRSFRKYLRGGVEEVLGLSTLGSKTLVKVDFSDIVTEKTFASSIVAAWSMSNFTPAVQDGPIMVGVAISDYSAAEIEEFVEQTNSWDEGDLVNQEKASRKIKTVGILIPTTSDVEHDKLNGGRLIKTRLNWSLRTGLTIAMWAYNMGDSTLATTNPQVHVAGHVNLWPR